MSSAVQTPSTPFEKLARTFNRPKLLNLLNLPKSCTRVEDFDGLRCFNPKVKSALAIHKSHVPQVGKVPGGVCSGAKLWRHGRVTVGVPCCETNVSDETGFCPHCEKLWMSAFDSDGFVEVDELTMEETIEIYESGKPGVLFNAPAMVHAEDIFFDKQSSRDER